MPRDLPDDPVLLKQLLKQLLEQMISERESDKGKIVHLEEENALLRQRLFGRKSEQSADPLTPQLALFNEAKVLQNLSPKRRKKKPLHQQRNVEIANHCPQIYHASKLFMSCLSMN